MKSLTSLLWSYYIETITSVEPVDSFLQSDLEKMIAELHKFLGLQMKSDYWGKGEKLS